MLQLNTFLSQFDLAYTDQHKHSLKLREKDQKEDNKYKISVLLLLNIHELEITI